VEEWMETFTEIRGKIERGAYRIGVRLPQCFVSKQEFAEKPEYYGYCPVKLGERVM
jgi:hypothetical protein